MLAPTCSARPSTYWPNSPAMLCSRIRCRRGPGRVGGRGGDVPVCGIELSTAMADRLDAKDDVQRVEVIGTWQPPESTARSGSHIRVLNDRNLATQDARPRSLSGALSHGADPGDLGCPFDRRAVAGT